MIGQNVLRRQVIKMTVTVIVKVVRPVEVTASAIQPRQQVFNELIELSAHKIVSTISWGHHRQDTDGIVEHKPKVAYNDHQYHQC